MSSTPAIHNYHPETGEYLMASVPDRDPLDRTRYLIPAFATVIAPPAAKNGFIRRFQNGAWGYSPIVEPETPPTVEPLATAAMVNAERDRRIAAGTAVEITGYGVVPLQGRIQDQTNLLGLATAATLRIAAGDVDTLTKFRDAVNLDHFLTPLQIVEMWSKGAAWISSVFEASWELKAAEPIPLDFATDTYWP